MWQEKIDNERRFQIYKPSNGTLEYEIKEERNMRKKRGSGYTKWREYTQREQEDRKSKHPGISLTRSWTHSLISIDFLF